MPITWASFRVLKGCGVKSYTINQFPDGLHYTMQKKDMGEPKNDNSIYYTVMPLLRDLPECSPKWSKIEGGQSKKVY